MNSFKKIAIAVAAALTMGTFVAVPTHAAFGGDTLTIDAVTDTVTNAVTKAETTVTNKAKDIMNNTISKTSKTEIKPNLKKNLNSKTGGRILHSRKKL